MKIEDFLGEAFNSYKRHFVTFLVATIVAAVGSIFIITAPPLLFGLYFMGLKASRGEDVEVKDVLKGFDFFLKSWGVLILCFIAIVVGLICLIVPGLAFMILLQYAIPIAIAENAGVVESLKKSIRLGRENLQFTIILAIVTFVLNCIGGALQLGWLLTWPYTIVAQSMASKKLTEAKSA